MERLQWLCRYLLDENPRYADVPIPEGTPEQRQLFRALMNVRPPLPVSDEFLRLQDEELQEQLEEKGIVEIDRKGLVEWQGDITRLKVDAIVNAANSQMLGCFVPLHRCIDNAIHSAAGVQLRLACAEILRFAQNDSNGTYEEPAGSARITPGFNLPAKYVLHTVGPIVITARPLSRQEVQLASCYTSCLELSDKNGLHSIAFCCISTGEFRFPSDLACRIAVKTVRDYLAKHPRTSLDTIVFNTFKDIDHALYQDALAPTPLLK